MSPEREQLLAELKQLIRDAILEERERCAQVADAAQAKELAKWIRHGDASR